MDVHISQIVAEGRGAASIGVNFKAHLKLNSCDTRAHVNTHYSMLEVHLSERSLQNSGSVSGSARTPPKTNSAQIWIFVLAAQSP